MWAWLERQPEEWCTFFVELALRTLLTEAAGQHFLNQVEHCSLVAWCRECDGLASEVVNLVERDRNPYGTPFLPHETPVRLKKNSNERMG